MPSFAEALLYPHRVSLPWDKQDVSPDAAGNYTTCELPCRLVTLAAGAAAGKFLRYEHKAPTVAAQTAYGVEVELEGYSDKYDGDTMLFMDFRRHHSGVWDGTAARWATQ